MNWKAISKIIGILTLILSLFMAPSLLLGIYSEDKVWKGFAISEVLAVFFGGVFLVAGRKSSPIFLHRDSFLAVSCSWLFVAFVGALPYYFTGIVETFTDAFFESVSGFTTTGATVLTNLDSMSKSIHLWRATTQWLGGMGIIVLSVAILPFLGIGGMEIYKAEVPSPVVDKLKPRIQDTAKMLWLVYILLSALQFLLLLASGLTPFESLCHTFTTMPTGGFSTRDASVGGLNNPLAEWIMIIFMTLAGINFSLHYEVMLRGKLVEVIKNSELQCFFIIIITFTAMVVFSIKTLYNQSDYEEIIRHATFHIVSIITTTGYITQDYDKWPDMPRFLIFISMFFGAMAGSTGGGIKIMRLMILYKHVVNEFDKLIHPHIVKTIRLGNKVIPDEITRGVLGFFILYMTLFVVGVLILVSTGTDFMSSLGAVASSIGNVGPGFGSVGPVFTYQGISTLGKWSLAFLMILGRLEIMTLLVLIAPGFWKR